MKEQKVWVSEHIWLCGDTSKKRATVYYDQLDAYQDPGAVPATLLIEEDPEWVVDLDAPGGCIIIFPVKDRDMPLVDFPDRHKVRAKDAQSALAAALKLREGK